MNGFGKATASQIAEKVWFWVAQRFSAAIRPLFPSAALAAEVTDSTFLAASSAVPPRANRNAGLAQKALAVYYFGLL